MAEAAAKPWLARELTVHGRELWPRFAQRYAELRALPRRVRRALQRKLKLSLAGAALLLALGGGAVQANDINVAAGAAGIANDNQCGLIEAIDNANDTTTGRVHNECTPGDQAGADTIILPASSTFTLDSVNNATYGSNGLPLINSEIII